MEELKKWIKCAGVRALKTVAQTAVSLITVGVTMSEVDWLVVGSTSLLAGILSLLTIRAAAWPTSWMHCPMWLAKSQTSIAISIALWFP